MRTMGAVVEEPPHPSPSALIRAEDRLQILRRILHATYDLPTVEEIASIAVRALAAHLPDLRVGYATTDPHGVLSVTCSAQPESMPDLTGIVADVSCARAYLESLLAARPVAVTDVRTDPRTIPLAGEMAADGTLACLDVPLMDRGNLIGILFLDSPTTHVWTDEEVETLSDVAGQIATALVEARLNDERRQALQDLRQSEERFRQISDHLGEVIWMTSADKGECLYIGKGYEELWGRPIADLMCDPLDWLQAVHPDDRQRVEQTLPHQLSGSYDQTYRVVRPDGSVRWVRDRAFPVRGEDGEIYRIAGFNTDVTQQREDEERLRAMERDLGEKRKMEALGTLAGGIAHDFNNLLSAILGFTEIALIGVEKGEQPTRQLREVLRASERARELVEQIQTFSQPDAGELQPMLLGPVVEEVLELVQPSWPEDVAIESSIEEHLHLLAAPTQVHQVVMNLVTNARLAMDPEGGRLRVEATEVLCGDGGDEPAGLAPGRYARLSVADTGRGIAPEVLPRIFDPFFSAREGNKGSGMGLAVVKSVAEGCGGAVDVHSVQGAGSTFRVYLPLCLEEIPVQPAPPPRPDAAPLGAGRVLFVDDEAYQVRLARQVFAQLGYRVEAIGDPREALAAFADDPYSFDVVVTDLRMPGLSGLELAREIRDLDAEVPVVVCTGFAELAAGDLSGLEPIQLAAKPLSLRRLSSVLERALGGVPHGG